MKPNMGRGHGRGSGMSSRGQNSSIGPLMTDHLQLQNLDLELALLKRKREMIEEQQKMLASSNNFFQHLSVIDYNQPSRSFQQQQNESQQFNRTSRFAHFYNDPPQPQFDRQQGIKRQADVNWQQNSPPKRFGGHEQTRPKKPGFRSAPGRPTQHLSAPKEQRTHTQFMGRSASNNTSRRMNSDITPLMGHGYRPPASRPRKDFNPTRVAKPKPVTLQNKLNSLPTPERKKLVTQTSDLVNKKQDGEILEAGKPPSRTANGRLELALGAILKELKENFGNVSPHVDSFRLPHRQKAMKQAIRERIHCSMLGKRVGTMPDILKVYRGFYPKEKDSEILDVALNVICKDFVPKLAIELVDTALPEKYFRMNFNKLLDFKLDQIFDKLESIYDSTYKSKMLKEFLTGKLIIEEKSVTEDVEEVNNQKDPENSNEVTNSDQTETESSDKNETATSDPNEVQNTAQNDINPDDNKNTSEEKDSDQKETEKSGAKENNESTEANEKEEHVDLTDDGEQNVEEIDLTETTDTTKSSNNDTGIKRKTVSARNASRYFNRLLDGLLSRRLPVVLPRYKDRIIKILNSDESFRTTKNVILKNTEEKTEKYNKNLAEKDAKQDAAQAGRNIQYYVKIMGRPSLPKRVLMQAFLNKFHPKYIKKHRGIDNLLFVGFGEQSDYENILAANQTVIGTSTLDIKISENIQANAKKPQPTDNNDSDVEMIETKNEPIKILDDSELENQIDNLLTSIRAEEEKTSANLDIVVEETENAEVQDNAKEPNGDAEKEPTDDNKEIDNQGGENGEALDENPNIDESADNVANNDADNPQEVEPKNEVNTPAKTTRNSTRLANTGTPSAIRTRRASRLAQNN